MGNEAAEGVVALLELQASFNLLSNRADGTLKPFERDWERLRYGEDVIWGCRILLV